MLAKIKSEHRPDLKTTVEDAICVDLKIDNLLKKMENLFKYKGINIPTFLRLDFYLGSVDKELYIIEVEGFDTDYEFENHTL